MTGHGFRPGTGARASVPSCLLPPPAPPSACTHPPRLPAPSELVFQSVKWGGWVQLWAGVCPLSWILKEE